MLIEHIYKIQMYCIVYTGEGGLRKKTHLPGALHQPTQPKAPLHAQRLSGCYAVLKAGSLALYSKKEINKTEPEAVFLFEPGTRVEVCFGGVVCFWGVRSRLEID